MRQKKATSKLPPNFGERLLSKLHTNLVSAEEEYIKACGWKLVKRSRSGLHSIWKHPMYTMQYSRNHAVMLEKSRDENLGIH